MSNDGWIVRLCSRALALLACAICLSSPLPAEIKLSMLFGEGMVLQRERAVKLWGSAAPAEQVRASIGDENVSTQADAAGRWSLELAPHKAGGPHELRVNGTNELRVRDVWFGDVWLCAGQSNMQVPLSVATDGKDEVGELAKLDLRLFALPVKPTEQRASEVDAHWTLCGASDAERLSAVAYFFVKELRTSVDVPIGLIQAVAGGTPAETWTNIDALRADPQLAPSLQRATRAADSKPGALFNGMIAPLAGCALTGVIWYQGEANVGLAEQYRVLFPTLIGSWRRNFARADLPFLFVQLPGFGPPAPAPGPSTWAELRQAQTFALALPHTAMAVAIDVGDVDLHPLRKRDVGTRLARLALVDVYAHAQTVARGPSVAGVSIEGSSVNVRFDHADGGLQTRKGEELAGFALAGADKRWVWAQARIDGDKVVVHSPDVSAPVAVRYAWADNPPCSLYNGAGLPAQPFRSDDWR